MLLLRLLLVLSCRRGGTGGSEACSRLFFRRLTSTRPPVIRLGLASLAEAGVGALPMPTR